MNFSEKVQVVIAIMVSIPICMGAITFWTEDKSWAIRCIRQIKNIFLNLINKMGDIIL